MDLLEAASGGNRHPWELSRARAVEHVLRRFQPSPVRTILDWGCGDAFTGRFLLERLGADKLVGIDPHLTDEMERLFAAGDPRVSLVRREQEVPSARFDLTLCCDVIEHVPDDSELLSALRSSFVASTGRLIVTVPAFQSLFSSLDVALKHFRRYSLRELEGVLRKSGFEVLGSGYLFATLLPVRAVGKLLERRAVAEETEDGDGVGLGRWRGGRAATRLTQAVLSADNSVMLALAERGLKLPGLSVWAVCAPSG